MKRFKLCALISALVVTLGSSMTVHAAERDIKVDITKEYASATFNIQLESNGVYEGYLTSPSGKQYDCTTVGDSSMTCSIDKIEAGEWVLTISDDTQSSIPKATVSLSSKKETETDVVDKDNISVGKDIVGLKTYFVNDNFVAEWSDESVGDVSIQIVNLDTNETIANTTVSEMRFECPLKEDVKNISVNIVPSSSANVSGAALSYTFKVDNHPDATVSFPKGENTNANEYPVSVNCKKPYGVRVEVNGADALKDNLSNGGHELSVPLGEDGSNTISVFIIDENGNMRSFDKIVYKDTEAPTFEFKEEYDGLEVTDSSVVVVGKCTGFSTLTANGEAITATTDGTFEYSVFLHDGANEIVFEATDEAGNVTTYPITLQLVKKRVSLTKENWLSLIALIGIIAFLVIRRKHKKTANANKTVAVGDTTEQSVIPAPLEEQKKEFKQPIQKEKKCKEKRKIVDEAGDDEVHSVKEAITYICTNKFTSTLLLVLIAVTMFFGVCDLNYTTSESMYPTISIPAISITNDLAYVIRPVQRGDIISFYHEDSIFGKRVIGIEGDEIEFHDGYVYINGVKYDEPYLSEDIETNCNHTFVVPEDCVFVLGDNREISNDSRCWDNPYVPVSKIKGKIVFIWNLK